MDIRTTLLRLIETLPAEDAAAARQEAKDVWQDETQLKNLHERLARSRRAKGVWQTKRQAIPDHA